MEKLIKGDGDRGGELEERCPSLSSDFYHEYWFEIKKSEDKSGRKSKHSPQLQGGLIIRMGWSSI